MDDEVLAPLRDRLAKIDEAIIGHLAERFRTIREIADVKRSHDISMMQPSQVDVVLDRAGRLAGASGVDVAFARDLFARIVDEACAVEDEIIEGVPRADR